MRLKWLVGLVVFCVIFGGVFFWARQQKQIFQAVATVRILEEAEKSKYPLITEVKKITSQPVMARVVFELGWADGKSPRVEIQNRIAELQGMVFPQPEEKNHVIRILVENEDPRLAARISNAVAKSYQEVNMLEKREKITDKRKFLEGRVKVAKEKLYRTEEKLKALKEQGMRLGRARDLETQIVSLQKQQFGLLETYTADHPNIIRIAADMDALRKELQGLPSEEELVEVMQVLRDTETAYRNLDKQYQETRLLEEQELGNARMLQSARIPKKPIRGDTRPVLIGGALLAFVLSLLTLFLLNRPPKYP